MFWPLSWFEVLAFLRRRALWILLAALVGGALGGGAAALRPPTYRATALLVGEVNDTAPDLPFFVAAQLNGAAARVRGPDFQRRLLREEGLDLPRERLAEALGARAYPERSALELFVDLGDPLLAQEVAAAAARVLARTVTEEAARGDPLQLHLSLRSAGVSEARPVGPAPLWFALGAGLLGAVLGGLAFWVWDGARSPLDDPDQVEALEVPILASAEAPEVAWNGLRLLSGGQVPGLVACVPLVPERREAAAAGTIALAEAAAAQGLRVLLVDADLWDPRFHRYLGIEPEPGLTEVLLARGLEPPIFESRGMSWLLAGQGEVRPELALASAPLRELLDRLRQRFELIFLRLPPPGPRSGLWALAPAVDGVVCWVGRGDPGSQLRQSLRRWREREGGPWTAVWIGPMPQ